ncbi:hypothetical protein Pcinc_024845 [Petrolisthes cinctipes]|uniref:Kazal-like domain-containing protein n=1 Tax=Petrolisthes cinctipes TaxID=88211 RepID=A0AAE1KEP1_PETCI|nr:hypothetical protein Pcinc_024845 [Petrolisthes cinctipes]
MRGCVLGREGEWVGVLGGEDPCEHMVCQKGEVCLADDGRVPRCQCNSTCPSTLSPVCASDGTTYSNECTMNFEGCRRREVLTILYRGKCSSGMNPCGALRCGSGQGCAVNQYGVATCRCPSWCPPVVTPVCGSDGLTYDSRCHLEKEACDLQRDIIVDFVGTCASNI